MQKSFGVVKKRQEKDEQVDFRKFNIEELLLDLVSHIFHFQTSFFLTIIF